MEWLERYQTNVNAVFASALERIEAFPAPLNEIGLRYAASFDPAKHNGQDYICVLLPYWLQDATGISDEQCNRLTLANVYGMLYFFIQDDVMDNPTQTYVKGELALANLLHLEMLSVLRGLFPSDSPFWTYYGRYITTWADCVMNEHTANYFINDPIRTAGKAGPIKLSSTGACLLAGREELIPVIESAVDLSLMTLQMLDDWADWRIDFAEGSYNGLIAMVAHDAGMQAGELTKEKVETQIYVLGCLKRLAEIAKRNHDLILKLQLPLPDLVRYHAYMVEFLVQTAETIENQKRKLLGGGINRFLS
ncbi:hypothetical protein D3P08_22985 [Paenibacillus nanensis]|uniref:Uncharacterized protein n=1 Tax=Paenibacillus nanensis TaxID=393251 RepID=A0A3A1UUD0_9BACL|nr:hypothetical protein [Paenibacillus nanensis]RIX49414.1 hypothetical protein D3P08_22985 [Paenibacillus nanensis]